MKNKRKLRIILLGLSLMAFTGCGKSTDTADTAASSSPSAVSASSELPESVNEYVTTSSTYYEEPEPAADTGEAEGFVPADIPEGTLTAAEIGKEFSFTENGTAAYAVTIDSAAFTDRRSVVPGNESQQVLLITYTYRSLNGEPRLVDDMSFRLFIGETPQESYNVSDQIMGDISSDSPVTAEVCFAVPADASDFTLYAVDNTEENNESYQIQLNL